MSAREKAKERSVAAPGANRTVNTVTRRQQVLQGIFPETFTPGLSSKAGIDEMDLAFIYFFSSAYSASLSYQPIIYSIISHTYSK